MAKLTKVLALVLVALQILETVLRLLGY